MPFSLITYQLVRKFGDCFQLIQVILVIRMPDTLDSSDFRLIWLNQCIVPPLNVDAAISTFSNLAVPLPHVFQGLASISGADMVSMSGEIAPDLGV